MNAAGGTNDFYLTRMESGSSYVTLGINFPVHGVLRKHSTLRTARVTQSLKLDSTGGIGRDEVSWDSGRAELMGVVQFLV